MKVIAQEPWSWTLFQASDGFYFCVLCGGAGMQMIDFALTDSEADSLKSNLPIAAKAFAASVRSNADRFIRRHLSEFSKREDVRSAVLRWRKNPALDA